MTRTITLHGVPSLDEIAEIETMAERVTAALRRDRGPWWAVNSAPLDVGSRRIASRRSSCRT
ncbi:hypothetical protein [Deinococcus yavapaiensis]|uniref:hypothetical protein n=1 Tax=Deinococcus yavapaiensis TaxID=309889 RepID=UPI000DA1C4CE|nr:hypothetical protein [Deinococcus yavapaiensis]